MENRSSGIGIFGLLGVVFVVLKLTNYIDWSWWYVTLPFWGGIALAIFILIICKYTTNKLINEQIIKQSF